MGAKITTALIERMRKSPPAKPTEVSCTEIPGFGLRVFPTGVVTFAFYYRVKGAKRKRRISIGRYGPVTLDKARRTAADAYREVRLGGDPAESARLEAVAGVTVGDVVERYLSEGRLKPSTIRSHRNRVEKHLRALKHRPVAAVLPSDVVALHSKISTSAPGQANRVVSLLRAAINRCQRLGMIPDAIRNPAIGVTLNREEGCERFLEPEERARLLAAIQDCSARERHQAGSISHGSALLFEFLLATGMRLSEATTLRWEWVHLRRAQLHLPDSKTGRKVIHLGGAGLDVLKRVGEKTKPNKGYVFRTSSGKPIRNNIQRCWQRLRAVAELDGRDGKPPVRIHDLRHSYISDAVMAGVPLEVAAGLVGHRSVKTTQRYRHISDRALAEAARVIDQGRDAAQRP